jgi:hypothetical protein
MEFLDINYSEVQEVNNDNNILLNMLYFFIDAGVTSKEPVDGDALAKELDKPSQELLQTILTTKPDPQEKAIVTALINKYKNLDSDKKDVEEFKMHLKNMIESNAIGYGSFNYLLERVTSGNVKDRKEATPQQPEQPQVDPSEQPQQGQPGQEQEQSAQGQPADTNNSDMTDDLIENWDMHFSEDNSELTEDDYSDILGDSIDNLVSGELEVMNAESKTSHLRSSEENKVGDEGRAKAIKFLKSKYKESKYSEMDKEDEGFDRAATFLILKEKEFSETLMDLNPNLPRLNHNSAESKVLAFLHDKFGYKPTKKTLESTYSEDEESDSDSEEDNNSYLATESEEVVELNKDKTLKVDKRGNLVTK